MRHSSAPVPPDTSGPTRNRVDVWLAVLAPCWFVIGGIGASWLFVLSTSPFGDAGVADPFAGLQDPPGWTGISSGAGSQIDFLGALVFLPWLLMSVLLLVLGLRRLSQVSGLAIWWKIVWTCGIGLGIALAVLVDTSFNFPPYISSARAVSWGELPIALGFLLLAVIMWLVTRSLTIKGRQSAPRTGDSGR